MKFFFKFWFNYLISQFINAEIPARRKKGIVKMIPKKQDDRENPINVRPITLTNCSARLCERVVLIKINEN